MKFLQNEIKTKKDIAYYIDNLYNNDMLYHFDDDAKDIINFQDFSNDTTDLLNARTDEALSIDYDYALEYICKLLKI
jgi:hypothetical protein